MNVSELRLSDETGAPLTVSERWKQEPPKVIHYKLVSRVRQLIIPTDEQCQLPSNYIFKSQQETPH